MKSIIASRPPLHRRFDEHVAITHIQNRYQESYENILKQVSVLQNDTAFRQKCRIYYDKGYKDWVILNTIYTCMLNWKANDLGLKLFSDEDRKKFIELRHSLQNAVYEPNRFISQDFDIHIKSHAVLVLKTYGFELRRRDFKPEVVEKFLRVRMKHYEFDYTSHASFWGTTW